MNTECKLIHPPAKSRFNPSKLILLKTGCTKFGLPSKYMSFNVYNLIVYY